MEKKKNLFAALFIHICISVGLLTFCITNVSAQSSGKSKKIASMQKAGNDQLIVCDFGQMNDTLVYPLSTFTEEMKVVKLDNRDEALVGGWVRTKVSDNYILVSNNKQTPYKLFERASGKFITSIGSYGEGPEEYMNTYDEYLDEKNKRVYILGWNATKILVFDFQGVAQSPIPLPTRIPKGQFTVNPVKSEVTITMLPFEGSPAVVWVQDFQGKLIQHLPPRHLMAPRDFSNEVTASRNTDAYDVMLMLIMPTRKDTLYHYNQQENRLIPRFTTKYPGEDVPWHSYLELPNHFLGQIQSPVKISETTTVGSSPVWYIVDKKTLQGNYFQLIDDYYGDSKSIWSSFGDGYYVVNMEPSQLKERLEKALKDSKVPKERKDRIKKLHDSLDDNDNNVVMYAKLKK